MENYDKPYEVVNSKLKKKILKHLNSKLLKLQKYLENVEKIVDNNL